MQQSRQRKLQTLNAIPIPLHSLTQPLCPPPPPHTHTSDNGPDDTAAMWHVMVANVVGFCGRCGQCNKNVGPALAHAGWPCPPPRPPSPVGLDP